MDQFVSPPFVRKTNSFLLFSAKPCPARPRGQNWAASANPHLELEPVGDHGNELRIGGLALGVADGVAEILLQDLQVAPVPGHLDGVADGCACRPTKNGFASKQICCLICWYEPRLFIGLS